MDCPFCGKEMKEGVILNGTKWVEDGADALDSVSLCNDWFARGPKSFFCRDCRQIVLPVPEIEDMLDKMQKKIDAASEKLSEVQKQWEMRRTEKQKETKKKKSEGKDPWEL